MTTILHVHNVAWLGGVPAFIADFARAFPEFHHQSLYLKDGGEDRGAIQMLNDAGVNSAFADGGNLSPGMVAHFSPGLVVLHNISGKNVVGSHPWDWLKQWPTISYHHSTVSPTIPSDVHVFVSEHLKSFYTGLIKSYFIRVHEVIPPCITCASYAKVRPKYQDKIVGKVATPGNAMKYPFTLLEVARAVGAKLIMPGAAKHFPVANDVIDVSPTWWGVPSFLGRMSAFLYVNHPSMKPETWGRAVTEAMAAGLPVIGENRGGVAEQIEHGVSGYLVDPDDKAAMVQYLYRLVDNPRRATRMGHHARHRALEIADISVLRTKLMPHMLRLMAGGV